MAKRGELTELQKAFCDYYLMNNNAAQSYRLAFDPDGKKEIKQSTCYANGSKLLRTDKIKNYMSEKRNLIQSDRILTATEILEHLSHMATDLSLKPGDRIKALELLGKNNVLFTDKSEVSTNMDIEINLVGMDEETDDIE